ncbi:MAG: hypothetical protein IT331_24175 [Anaerolineae bacterium]|nr:hypothetical protein [Anaerolineae bacterium]
MRHKWLFAIGFLIVMSALLGACDANNATSSALATAPSSAQNLETNAKGALEAQTLEDGSVTVKVIPVQTNMNAPLEFEIVMDTHSVDLANDMLKTVVLRDDAGKEYMPLKWAGPGAGGHHRQGTIQFGQLKQTTKTLTLLVKNVAGVPERVFEWELAQ